MKGKKYSPEQVQRIIDEYVITGNYNETTERIRLLYADDNISPDKATIWRIINRNKQRVATLKKDRDQILDRAFTRILNKCTERMEQTVNTAGFRDSAIVSGVCYDKRALIRGEPTSRIGLETEESLAKRLSGRAVEGNKLLKIGRN